MPGPRIIKRVAYMFQDNPERQGLLRPGSRLVETSALRQGQLQSQRPLPAELQASLLPSLTSVHLNRPPKRQPFDCVPNQPQFLFLNCDQENCHPTAISHRHSP